MVHVAIRHLMETKAIMLKIKKIVSISINLLYVLVYLDHKIVSESGCLASE